MDDSTLHNRGETSPRSERKRPREHGDTDERSVRRRGDGYGHGTYIRRARSRSPRRSDHRDYTRVEDASHARHRHGDPPGHRGTARHRTGSRSRSPARHRHSHRHRSHHASKASRHEHAPELPCDARPLSRSADFDTFRPLFARYLDIQKQIDIAALDEREVRGRWKSFVSKWNSCELAEGWYRPETFEDVMLDAREVGDKPEGERRHERRGGSPARQETDLRSQDTGGEEKGDDDDDDYGPTLPAQEDPDHGTRAAKSPSQTKHGPGIPTLSDITLRRELEASDRDDVRALLRHERKADRALQKERLDELAPRADAGTQARRLEKRREVRDANAAFANAKTSTDMPELADADLMGGGGGIDEYKRLRREAERKKTEREVRREEIWRAKKEEREVRAREYREREASTVDMLREIAKSRFG